MSKISWNLIENVPVSPPDISHLYLMKSFIPLEVGGQLYFQLFCKSVCFN